MKKDINRQAERLHSGFKQVEQQRVKGYEDAQTILTAKQAMQTKERDRLAAKYGENHSRVRQLDQRQAATGKLIKAVDSQHVRASNPVPDLAPGAWQLNGRVTDRKANPATGLTISLFNGDSVWEQPLGYTCTNPSGYFNLLVLDTELVRQYLGVPLYLTVTDAERHIVHTDPRPIYLVQNKTVVRLVILNNTNCTAPEANTRIATDGPPSETTTTTTNTATDRYLLSGDVKSPRNGLMAGVTVKAVAVTSTGDFDLGKESLTNENGRYQIPYSSSDFKAKPGTLADIVLTVYDTSGKELFQSKPYKAVPQIGELNISLDE